MEVAVLKLPLPVTTAAEDKKLLSILRKPDLAPHGPAWTAAYASYRTAKGDPWQLSPVSFSPCIKAAQLKLYDTRKGGGPLHRIRHTKGLVCCPLCGSPTTGTLDHYLPKDDYPEFAVMPSNLVPACSLCNSGAKGRKFKGAKPGERFLHPYFDTFASAAVWQVCVTGPPEAPTFTPEVAPGVPPSARTIVEFHLANIFGQTFQTQLATYWSQLPATMAEHYKVLRLTSAQAWATELSWTTRTLGLNGWRAALLRGVMSEPALIAHVDAEALKL